MADVNELLGERQKATEWFIQLLSVVPSDTGVLRRMGQLCDAAGDKSQAFHYFSESHRYDPNNVDVLEWLGMYYFESQLVEKVARASIPMRHVPSSIWTGGHYHEHRCKKKRFYVFIFFK